MNAKDAEFKNRTLFPAVERELLAAAEARVKDIPVVDALGLKLGGRMPGQAFAEGGALRFEVGRPEYGRFVPVPDELLYLIDDGGLRHDCPLEQKPRREAYAHLTPVTRRIDRIVVREYWGRDRGKRDEAVAGAVNALADALRRTVGTKDVAVRSALTRYVANLCIETSVSYAPMQAANVAERKAVIALVEKLQDKARA